MQVTRGHGGLENFLARQRAVRVNALLPRRLQEGRILDIGCGTVPLFLQQSGFRQRFGLDPVVRERRAEPGLLIQHIDGQWREKLAFPESFFSAVTLLAVYEHIMPERLDFVVREMWRVLAPGGRLVITTPAPQTAPLLFVLSHIGLISKEELREHQPLSSRRQVGKQLVRAGVPADRVRSGSFQLGFNQWIYADK